MKAVFSALTGFCIFILGWMLFAALLGFMGWAAANSGYAPDLLLFVHVGLLWILSPGLGASLAIMVTAQLFRSVPLSTIYVSFVSICSTLFLVLFFFSVTSNSEPIFRLVIFVLQVVSIFVGAYIGQFIAKARRFDPKQLDVQ